jgi:hypothetical protein
MSVATISEKMAQSKPFKYVVIAGIILATIVFFVFIFSIGRLAFRFGTSVFASAKSSINTNVNTNTDGSADGSHDGSSLSTTTDDVIELNNGAYFVPDSVIEGDELDSNTPASQDYYYSDIYTDSPQTSTPIDNSEE